MIQPLLIFFLITFHKIFMHKYILFMFYIRIESETYIRVNHKKMLIFNILKLCVIIEKRGWSFSVASGSGILGVLLEYTFL